MDHAGDVLAIGNDYVVYYISPGQGLYYWNMSTNAEGLMTLESNRNDDAQDGRMDGNGVVWIAIGSDGREHVYYAFLGQPDLSVSSADILFSNDHPMPGDAVDVTVSLHNINPWNATEPITVRLFAGDPDAGGTQWGQDIVIPGGLTAGSNAVVTFNDCSVPLDWEGPQPIYVQVSMTSQADNPANNKASCDLVVRDTDIGGPVIRDVTVADPSGDVDGLIGADEQITVSWVLADPSGLASTQLLIDGVVVYNQDWSSNPPSSIPCSVVLGPLGVGAHTLAIIATDGDNSPASSQVDCTFNVVPSEEITVSYGQWALISGADRSGRRSTRR